MCIVADANVLIDFLQKNRMDLIGAHPSSFISVNEVANEIMKGNQRCLYEEACNAGYLVQRELEDCDTELYVALSEDGWPFPPANLNALPSPEILEHALGDGESAAMSFARNRGYRLATNDNEALDYARVVFKGQLCTLGTADIAEELIQHGFLDYAEARRLFGDRFRQKMNRIRSLENTLGLVANRLEQANPRRDQG